MTDDTIVTTDEDAQDDHLQTDQIADYVSVLSQPGPLPNGVDQAEPTPFDANEVDFACNAWLARLLEVQAWLCLDQPLSADDPQLAVTSIFEQISGDSPTSCFTMSEGGHVRPTPLGRQHLETWLSRAVSHRQSFQEMLEDDRSMKDASADWWLLWEEAEAVSREPVAISAKVEVWQTKYFVDLATEGELDLNPSYQRDIVWSTSDSQLLIESLLRGIPLPSVILSRDPTSNALQIVDGKQRLTAILRFIGRHPEARHTAGEMAGGVKLFDENYRKFSTKNHIKPADVAKHFFPFKLGEYDPPDPLAHLSKKYYCQIKDEVVKIGNKETNIKQLFESVTSDYKIPVIMYSHTRIRDIHHVFAIYNKQGKKLNAEELRNATHHHLEFMRLLLVLSGDRIDQSEQLTPYLPTEVRASAANTGELLESLGFGVARFKRTKVLSWMLAALLHSPKRTVAGAFSTPSTASHITALLDTVTDEGDRHWLFQRNNLVSLSRDTIAGVAIHRDNDAVWHPRFRRREERQAVASKWEELPLVASLLATHILSVAGKASELSQRVQDLRQLTSELRAPKKTQNKDQWQHIARVVIAILKATSSDDETTDSKLLERYGYSCLPVLRELATGARTA